jgi:serine/threonine protein kinase
LNAPLLPALPGYDDPQLIAHGTTALVFRAIQTRLNRPVAIKVITIDTGAMPVNAERELATTVALSSQPHIVSIIDTGMTADDRPYIVMEYCDGGSYAQILRQNGPLPVEDVLEVGIKIGEALHAAHEVGIVHRDVKPSNILRSRFGPALTDFGIARAPDELGSTLTREMMTPHQASPEALLHQAQSGPSDLYSLASTMWTLLVGYPPFVDPAQPGIDMYLFRDKVLHDPVPVMPRDDVPAWLVGELGKAMAKLPAQRHGSAFEFAEALRRGALGLSPSPVSPSPASTGSPVSSLAADGSPTGVRVHVPGMPAQAWPVSEAPPVPVPTPPAPAPLLPSPEPAAATPPPPVPAQAPPAVPPPPGVAESASDIDGPLYQPAPAPRGSRAALRYHPLSGEERPTPVLDEGGWLGTGLDDATHGGRAEPDPTTAHVLDTRRFAEREVPAPTGGRRGGLLAVLLGVTLIAVASGALLLLRSNNQPSAAPPDDPLGSVSPTLITAGITGAPTDLAIQEDRGTSVTLTFTDPTGGVASYIAIRRPSNGEGPETKAIPPGQVTKSVTFTGLNRDRNYCFAVTIIYSVTNVASTPDVCTKR